MKITVNTRRRDAIAHRTASRAFSKVDLLVTLVIVALLAAGGVVWLRTAPARNQRNTCLSNLRQVGLAFAIYAQDNEARLPYAGFRLKKGAHWSWDDLLDSGLGTKFSKQQLQSDNPTNDRPVLRCPADDVAIVTKSGLAGAHRRSYALPLHNMSNLNWPPARNNQTGIGLKWSGIGAEADPFSTNQNRYVVPPPQEPASKTKFRQECITTEMIALPAKTIALTERITPYNIIGNVTECTVRSADSHMDLKYASKNGLHQGKFTYLFLDGHADALEPMDTLGKRNKNPGIQSGLWTIKKDE